MTHYHHWVHPAGAHAELEEEHAPHAASASPLTALM